MPSVGAVLNSYARTIWQFFLMVASARLIAGGHSL
jgi:hypothetical protein